MSSTRMVLGYVTMTTRLTNSRNGNSTWRVYLHDPKTGQQHSLETATDSAAGIQAANLRPHDAARVTVDRKDKIIWIETPDYQR